MTDRAQIPTDDVAGSSKRRPVLNSILWIIQVLLALLFLFAGVTKLVLPLESLKGPVDLPGWFLRFIGVCEVLGGLGLILPGLLRIRPKLTPLATAGLVIIMIGAVAVTLASVGVAAALIPLLTGALLMFVGYSRWRIAPHRERTVPSIARPSISSLSSLS
ncbi:MAG TPA: DoxX family protein [Blastocatellia bacterium]|nr:DoxX family protein [Blastocatellia bacterium]